VKEKKALDVKLMPMAFVLKVCWLCWDVFYLKMFLFPCQKYFVNISSRSRDQQQKKGKLVSMFMKLSKELIYSWSQKMYCIAPCRVCPADFTEALKRYKSTWVPWVQSHLWERLFDNPGSKVAWGRFFLNL